MLILLERSGPHYNSDCDFSYVQGKHRSGQNHNIWFLVYFLNSVRSVDFCRIVKSVESSACSYHVLRLMVSILFQDHRSTRNVNPCIYCLLSISLIFLKELSFPGKTSQIKRTPAVKVCDWTCRWFLIDFIRCPFLTLSLTLVSWAHYRLCAVFPRFILTSPKCLSAVFREQPSADPLATQRMWYIIVSRNISWND